MVEGAGLARAGNPTAACSNFKKNCKDERAEVFFSIEVSGVKAAGWVLTRPTLTRQVVRPWEKCLELQ